MRIQATDQGSSQANDQDLAPEGSAASRGQEWAPLLSEADSMACRSRWNEIQAAFVDRPRESVEEADMLVRDLLQRLTAGFADQRSRLEGHWDRDDEASTEDLRVALTRYRSFFNRLLAA